MRFEPKSREQLMRLLPEGKYQGYVKSAEESVSKSTGNPMLVLGIEIYDADGKPWTITDRIVLTDSMQWKLLAFCESAELMDHYNAGELSPESCEGRAVNCKVTVSRQEGYDPKNEIKSYFVPKEAAPKRQPEGVSDKQRSAANKGKTEGEDCPF